MGKKAVVRVLRALGLGFVFTIFAYVISGSEMSGVLGTYIIYKELTNNTKK